MLTQKQEIKRLYNQCGDMALDEIIKMAREIMIKHPKAKEFIMGNGTCLFVDENDNRINEGDEIYKFFKDLYEFIDEWDDYLKLTGEPMRFTADGNIKIDW